MVKVDFHQIVEALDLFSAFGQKRGSSYQIINSNGELKVIDWKTNETAHFGNTLESLIKLKNLLKQIDAIEQAKAVDDAYEFLTSHIPYTYHLRFKHEEKQIRLARKIIHY